jgi:hypothetical protein
VEKLLKGIGNHQRIPGKILIITFLVTLSLLGQNLVIICTVHLRQCHFFIIVSMFTRYPSDIGLYRNLSRKKIGYYCSGEMTAGRRQGPETSLAGQIYGP